MKRTPGLLAIATLALAPAAALAQDGQRAHLQQDPSLNCARQDFGAAQQGDNWPMIIDCRKSINAVDAELDRMANQKGGKMKIAVELAGLLDLITPQDDMDAVMFLFTDILDGRI